MPPLRLVVVGVAAGAALVALLTRRRRRGPADVVVVPGFLKSAIDYYDLVAALAARGAKATVVDISRWEWPIRVLGGALFDPAWYRGKQTPEGPAWGWIVRATRDAVAAAAGDDRSGVTLVGHSCGGWLARAAMGDDGLPGVVRLVRRSARERIVATPRVATRIFRGVVATRRRMDGQ